MLRRTDPWLLLVATATGACGVAGTDGSAPQPDVNHAIAVDELSLAPIELLGKRLFEDDALSEPRGTSCASWHDPAQAFQGNHGSAVEGVPAGSVPGTVAARNAPTLLYASLAPAFAFRFVEKETSTCQGSFVPVGGLFWDGRADTLEDQAKEPFLDPREMNNATPAAVVKKVRTGAYAELARTVLGAEALGDEDAAWKGIARAIAAFERSTRFHPFRSRFDDFLRGAAPQSAEEARGFALFKDPARGNCIACHEGKEDSRDPRDWLFTNYRYEAVGGPRNAAIPDNHDPARFDLGLCQRKGLADLAPPEKNVRSFCGAFRVPTLRNVARTAPYFHNGYFATLASVLSFYATRSAEPANWYPTDEHFFLHRFDDLPGALGENVSDDEVPYDQAQGDRPRLTDADVADLTAFLETLTDR